MENSELWKRVNLVFKQFQIEISGGGQMERALESWKEWVRKTRGVKEPTGIIVDYIIFQLYKNRQNPSYASPNTVTKYFSSKVAREKFLTQHNKNTTYYENEWLKMGNFNREDLYKYVVPKVHPMQKYVEMLSDDAQKLMNQRKGDLCLVYCKMFTKLWSPASNVCKECKYIEKCKEALGQINPELLRLRHKWQQAQMK